MPRIGGRIEHPCRQNRQQGIPCERKFPGQEFIQHDPEGIDICPRIDCFSAHLFWRDVHRSPIETTRITLGRCRLLQRTRELLAAGEKSLRDKGVEKAAESLRAMTGEGAWTPIKPTVAKADGAAFEIDDAGVVTLKGNAPDKATYTLELPEGSLVGGGRPRPPPPLGGATTR